MGLFDGLGENDADKRRVAVMRRQAQLLDEQIAEKQRSKRGGTGQQRDEKAYLCELFERDASPPRQLNQSPSIPRVQPPPQSQMQLAPQAPSAPVQQHFHYQQQLWANQAPAGFNMYNQVSPNRSPGQQAFMQQLQNELLNQPVMQLPSLLSQPLQPQLPKLPELPSTRARLQPWEALLGFVGAQPRPASLPPAYPARQKPIAPELDSGGELDAWRLHREAPKPLAFSALPEQASDRLPSKQQKENERRANNLIDIDAEWKQWESKRSKDHPFKPPGWRGAVSPQNQRPFQLSKSVAAAAGEESEGSKATAAPSPEPTLSQASGSASVSDSRRERPSQSIIPEGGRGSPDPNPLPPSSAQPPRPSAWAGSGDIRAAAASNLVNNLHKVKRSCLDERDQLRSQSDALKKEASRLIAEKVSLPSPSGRSHGFSQGPSQRQSEVPLPRSLPLATQPRVEPPPALVFSPGPLDSRSALFSPSHASIHGGVNHAGASFARSPAADALLLGSFSPSSGLPEASRMLFDLPKEPRSISTSPLKASLTASLLPQVSHLLYEPPKETKHISSGAPKESLIISKPAVSLPYTRHLSDMHRAKVDHSLPSERDKSFHSRQSRSRHVQDSSSLHASSPKREDLVQSIESRSERVGAGSAGPLPPSQSERVGAGSAGPLPPKQQELGQSTQSLLLCVSESILVPVPPENEEPGKSSQSQSGHVDEDSAVPLPSEQGELVHDIEIQSDYLGEGSVASSSPKLQVRVKVRINEDSPVSFSSEREDLSQSFQSRQGHLDEGSADEMPSKLEELLQRIESQADHAGESSESSAFQLQSKPEELVQSGLTQPEHLGEVLQSETSTSAAPAEMKTKGLSYADILVETSLDRTTPGPQPAPETRLAAGSIPASQPMLAAADSQPAPQSEAAAETQLALESTLRTPRKTIERMLSTEFLGTLQYSDSSGGETPAGGASARRRPPADLNKVIDLGAEMKKTQKTEASPTASSSEDSATRQRSSAFRKSPRGTQDFLISALINEDGSVGATSDQTSSPSLTPSGGQLLKRPAGSSQGSTGGSSDEDKAAEKTVMQTDVYSDEDPAAEKNIVQALAQHAFGNRSDSAT